MAEKAAAQGNTVRLMMLMEILSLEARHIDVSWALTLAGFAFKAEVECFTHVRISESLEAQLPSDREPERVRTPARGILFLACCLERWTHRPFSLLAACTHTRAKFGGRKEA